MIVITNTISVNVGDNKISKQNLCNLRSSLKSAIYGSPLVPTKKKVWGEILQWEGEILQWEGEISQWRGEISQWRGEILQWRGEISQWRDGISQ